MLDQGIEVFERTSDDGITYTGESKLYTLDVAAVPPRLDLVSGYPKPIPPNTPERELSRQTCG